MNAILNKEKILQVVQQARQKPHKSLECQLTLKNYDFKKDARFDSNCLLPHARCYRPKVVVLADEALIPTCQSLNIPFVDITALKDKKEKKKVAKKYKAFIALPTFSKKFEMRLLANKKRPLFMIRNPTELTQAFFDETCRTVKFKLRKSVNIFFSFANTDMSEEEISSNLTTALGHLIGLLKKGVQNVQTVYIKNTHDKAVKLF